MIRTSKYITLILICLSISVNSFAQVKRNATAKMVATLQMVEQLYVENTDMDKLVEKSIINTMKELDPHSVYISKEEFEAMNAPLQGNFEGIGIEFNIFEDTLIVVNPLVGGPSEKVGILSNDRIVEADGKNIVGITSDSVFKLLRGKKGSKIELGIKRRGVQELLVFNIIRDKIPLNSLDAAYMVKPEMLYLKLGRFAVTSMDEIKEAYNKFSEVKSLILDLRGNGGGVLSVAEELTDQFFDEGKLLVYTEGSKARKSMLLSTDKGIFKDVKVVVLVDGGSASASEIVSGAIQDWDRGIVVGRRTFGKGLVQQQIPYGDGSFLRLTVSRYHTPTGRVIQRPYDNGGTEKYYKELFDRFADGGEAFSIENLTFPDSLKYKTLKNGREVFGGGGIMPDIFIPIDTSGFSKYRNELYRKGIMMQFLIPVMEKEKNTFKDKYNTFEEYQSNFVLDDKMLNSLVEFAEKEGIKKDEQGIKTSGEEIKLVLKALIARDLFGYAEYYRILNTNNDKEYSKAIEILENWNKFEKEILFPKKFPNKIKNN